MNKKHITIWELMHNEHRHKVNESRKRSLLKGISMRILEITVDVFLLSFLGLGVETSLGASITIEGICFAVGYINERLWDKIQWGRKVKDVEKFNRG
jgi:uncharacterized membrane protein